jgi:hypothetical protein
MKMNRIFLLVLFTAIANFSYSQIIVEGSVWKYLDDGTDQDTAWSLPGFDDSGWAENNAKFGYGVDDLVTELSYGDDASNKYITYYFRKTFLMEDMMDISLLMLGLLRDDGAVVYINGEEVLRSNMPSGNIDYLTQASEAVYGESENVFNLYQFPAEVLHDGENTIAVEVHQISKMSLDLAFDLKLDFGVYSIFRKAPYLLYPANNTEMLVMWQMDSLRNCEFYWGTDTTYSTDSIIVDEFGNDHQFKVLLSDLDSKTKYFYKVYSDSSNYKTGSFYTGALDSDVKISFYAYGDTRSNPAIHDKVMETMMGDMEQHPEMQTFVISTGDLVYDGDKEADWDEEFFSPYFEYIQQMLSTLPYVNAVGNHEGQGVLFNKYFPYPMFVSERFYYSFDYGPAHFTVIDQFTDYGLESIQYEWLVNDLASTNKPWKFILLHEPGWSAGAHSNTIKVQNVIQPLCKEYVVQFVLTGHNHYYSRANVEGIFHITTGGGGAPLYTPDAGKPKIVKISKTNHFCKVEIDGDSLTFTAINKDGSIIESFRTGLIPDAVIEKPENLADSFKVFSNGNYIKIINKNHFSGSLSVYDNWGRKIYESKLIDQENAARIDVTGIYFVRIDFEGKQIVKKVFVN